jgi:hypothetical protein
MSHPTPVGRRSFTPPRPHYVYTKMLLQLIRNCTYHDAATSDHNSLNRLQVYD